MALGSKARSFIPMTPRSLKPNHDSRGDFAKQIADHTGRGQDGQPPQKKFRSSAAPKGTKFASGYTDRAKERLKEQEDAGDDVQQRLKALEKMVKDEEIDQETFEKLRDELGVGGDTSSTHLIKGLDFKLLERVRRGEDVTKAPVTAAEEEPPNAENEVEVEDELEKALEKNVAVSAPTKPQNPADEDDRDSETSNSAAHTATLTRNEILRRLKENRKNPGLSSAEAVALEAPQPSLDHSKFRKLESVKKPNKHKFTETINGRRREVLVITGKDGQTKRKTRWLDPEPDPSIAKTSEEQPWGGDLSAELLAKQKAAVEQAAKQDEDEEDDDIFGGVTEYDPLAGLNSDEDDDDGEKEVPSKEEEPAKETTGTGAEARSEVAKPLKSTAQRRNYFDTGTTESSEESSKAPSQDPTILAAIKRAAQIRKQEEAEGADALSEEDLKPTTKPAESSERSTALLKKLQQQSGQDDMDLDMGFSGDTRYDDDEGDGKQKLSKWRGIDAHDEDDEEEADKKGGDAKRKRGGKKRKGDKNSYTDVMNVIEGRKKG